MGPSIDLVLPAEERFSPERGGAIATVNREVALALARLGVGVRVISPAFDGHPYPGVAVSRMRFGRERSVIAKVGSRARRMVTGAVVDPHHAYRAEVAVLVGADVVVVHNDPVLATSLAGEGRRVVLWLHNNLSGRDGAALAACPPAIQIVAVSAYVRDWAAHTYGLPVERIAVIHNGVDTRRFHPPESWQPSDRLRVVMHARIDPNKGQDLAAQAVAALREDGTPVDLTIVGAVQTFGMDAGAVLAYEARLRGAASRAGATLLGRVPATAIPGLLRAFDAALAVPTVPEPFGLAAIEAMASGCALVAVPRGGLDEVVGDAAVRVEPTVTGVAEGLRLLARSPEVLRDYRVRGRERAMAFTWDAAAVDLLGLVDPR